MELFRKLSFFVVLITLCFVVFFVGCNKKNSTGPGSTSTVTDIDGNVYQTIRIGNQWWMAENLKVTHYRNGDPIPNVSDPTEWGNTNTDALCHYDNNEANSEIYGCLYNWYAAGDPRGLAPEGWHVPSDDEWKLLEMVLGMTQASVDSTGWRGTDEGGKLKEAGTTHWDAPNTGATNASGFTALPAGTRSIGLLTYVSQGNYTVFWSTTGTTNRMARELSSFRSTISRGIKSLKNGLSVRCIKDN